MSKVLQNTDIIALSAQEDNTDEETRYAYKTEWTKWEPEPGSNYIKPPVGSREYVGVKLRSGYVIEAMQAGLMLWGNTGSSSDIVEWALVDVPAGGFPRCIVD